MQPTPYHQETSKGLAKQPTAQVRGRSVDGMKKSPSSPLSSPAIRPRPLTTPPNRRYSPGRPSKRKTSRPPSPKAYSRKRLAVALLIVVLIAAGSILRFAAASELLIGTYAVIAFMRQIESRITFILALASLACVILLPLLQPAHELSESFAEYAFLLLIVGTISLVIETRRLGSRLSASE
jgi:hypothetical protein